MIGGLFVTGTDTGVGKTLVSCALIAALRDEGITVGVMKPVESGCSIRKGRPYPFDGNRLRKAAGVEDPLEKITPYALRAPVAPHLAAANEGIVISVQKIRADYAALARRYPFMLVEGPGGLLVPLTPEQSVADLAKALKLSLLVVAANRLGVLNHTLLTLEAAARRGLEVCGVILNNVSDRKDASTSTNPQALSNLLEKSKVPFLGVMDHLSRKEQIRSLGPRFTKEIEWRRAKACLGVNGGAAVSPEAR